MKPLFNELAKKISDHHSKKEAKPFEGKESPAEEKMEGHQMCPHCGKPVDEPASPHSELEEQKEMSK